MLRSNIMWIVYFISLGFVLISNFILNVFNGITFFFAIIGICAFLLAFYLEHVEQDQRWEEWDNESK